MTTEVLESKKASRVPLRMEEVTVLLQEASRGRALIIGTTTGLRAGTGAGQLLESALAAHGGIRTFKRIDGTLETLGPAGSFGDVPSGTRLWMEAGDLFEKLLEALGDEKGPTHIFCTDPWAATLLGRARSPRCKAVWIYVSRFEERAGPDASSGPAMSRNLSGPVP